MARPCPAKNRISTVMHYTEATCNPSDLNWIWTVLLYCRLYPIPTCQRQLGSWITIFPLFKTNTISVNSLKSVQQWNTFPQRTMLITTPVIHKNHSKNVVISLGDWNRLPQLVPWAYEECLKLKRNISTRWSFDNKDFTKKRHTHPVQEAIWRMIAGKTLRVGCSVVCFPS